MKKTPKYKAYGLKSLDKIANKYGISETDLPEIKLCGQILPFKTNNYVLEQLINWQNYREDPMFKLNFLNSQMLSKEHYNKIKTLIDQKASKKEIQQVATSIRKELNPHPAGQKDYNTPSFQGQKLEGIQHKYRETILLFPSPGQTCHAYCTYCFRWPQFLGKDLHKFSFPAKKMDLLVEYIQTNEGIKDVLITGGDPLVMKTKILSKFIKPLIDADIKHLRTIRIGTKSLSYWPYRFLTDKDSEKLLSLLEFIVDNKKHLAIMAHFTHYKELRTEALRQAAEKLVKSGAVIRTQAPILKDINDDAQTWIKMINEQVKIGMIPYYMFVPRNTGADIYFKIPLIKAWKIYLEAYRTFSGLGRTLRGPVMSCNPGKVLMLGKTTIENEKAIALKFIQGRNPRWVNKIFYAKYNDKATWIDQLTPLRKSFFYEKELFKYSRPYNEIKKIKKEK